MSQTNPRNSARRDAWRIQHLHEQVAAEMAERRSARHMRRAVMLGVVLGVAGSVASLCF